MNQLVEDYFLQLLEDADIVGAPDIYPGTCSEIRQPDNSAILIVADQVECVIGGLRKAGVKIVISSPAQDRAAHMAMAAAVQAVVEGTLPSAAEFSLGGWVTKTHQTQIAADDNRWLTSIEGILGFQLV